MTNIADVIRIYPQQITKTDVSYVVCCQNPSLPNFTLYSNVHLVGAWALIVGSEEIATGIWVESLPDEARIGACPGRSYRRLV